MWTVLLFTAWLTLLGLKIEMFTQPLYFPQQNYLKTALWIQLVPLSPLGKYAYMSPGERLRDVWSTVFIVLFSEGIMRTGSNRELQNQLEPVINLTSHPGITPTHEAQHGSEGHEHHPVEVYSKFLSPGTIKTPGKSIQMITQLKDRS